MTPAPATVAAAAALVLGRGAPPVPRALPPVARAAASPAAAVMALLGAEPGGVVAFGELHQTNASAAAGARSTLAWFTDEILPALAPRASHLIVETWMTHGACGAAEAKVTAQIEKTIERPPETENEIVRLLRLAKEAGVAPHVLEIGCDDYRALAGGASGDGGLDFDRLLTLTGRTLGNAVRQAALLPRAPGRPLVLVYGGALHNDLYPQEALAGYSFGPGAHAFMRGAYREIDLYLPELIARAPGVGTERWVPAWRRAARGAAGAGATFSVARSSRSAIVIFPQAGHGGAGGSLPKQVGR